MALDSSGHSLLSQYQYAGESELQLTWQTWGAIDDVVEARTSALKKHGPLTPDPVRACAILGREWGEAMNEALLLSLGHDRFVNDEHAQDYRKQVTVRLREELAQVAATAILMMEGLNANRET